MEVGNGNSERRALAIARDKLRIGVGEFQEASQILRHVLAEQAQLNTFLSTIAPPVSLEERCLANLTAFLVSGRDSRPSWETISCLRQLTPPSFRREFEYYLGKLLADDPPLGIS